MKNAISENLKEVSMGIWTRGAEVLCYNCHGRVFKNSEYNKEAGKTEDKVLSDVKFEDAKKPMPVFESNGVTLCEKCGKEIQINISTAQENNLCIKLKKLGINAVMSQTGGLNSAVELERNGEGFIWITYDIFGEEDVFEWYLGVYDNEGGYDGEYYSTTNLEDMVNYIIKLKNDNLIK